MKEGDNITYNEKEWKILLIEEDTVHLINDNGEGIAVLKTEL